MFHSTGDDTIIMIVNIEHTFRMSSHGGQDFAAKPLPNFDSVLPIDAKTGQFLNESRRAEASDDLVLRKDLPRHRH